MISFLFVHLANFSDWNKFPCKGCQDGYMVEHLMKKAYWSYARLPIQGLSSIVFHGPSPTWCLASDMIWFDHPQVFKVRCIPLSIVNQIRQNDQKLLATTTTFGIAGKNVSKSLSLQRQQSVFDWEFFETQGKRMCLRFSEQAFQQFSFLDYYDARVEADISVFEREFF